MSKKIYVIEASKLDERIEEIKNEYDLHTEFVDLNICDELKKLKSEAKAITIPTDEEVEKMADEKAKLNFHQQGYKWIRENGFFAGAKSIINQLTK